MRVSRGGESRPGRVAAAALAALLAASALGGCAWFEKNIKNPVKGLIERRMTITSDPPGADVFVNDVHQGKTPLTLTFRVGAKDLFRGFSVLVQKKGYIPLRRQVNFRTDRVVFRLLRRRRR